MKVIIGGWHATSLPVETKKDFPYFDFLVRGEGEITLHELIDTIENNKSLSKVNGIAYREDNKIRVVCHGAGSSAGLGPHQDICGNCLTWDCRPDHRICCP